MREQLDALTEKSEELNSSFMMLQSEHEDIKKLAQQLATECETYRPTLGKLTLVIFHYILTLCLKIKLKRNVEVI